MTFFWQNLIQRNEKWYDDYARIYRVLRAEGSSHAVARRDAMRWADSNQRARVANPKSPLLYGLPMPSRHGYAYTVIEDAGTYYLIRANTNWNEPKIAYARFPIYNVDCHPSLFVGKQLEDLGIYGRLSEYALGFEDSMPGRRCKLRIRSDIEPVKVEYIDAPRPKVRKSIEVRWNDGGWEKLLKRGWVPA